MNPMGASLACPDWYFVPTCNGEFLPEMTGGVLYEHGHRLWATFVGVLTLLLAVSLFRARHVNRMIKVLGALAVVMVALQGTLGGITVLLGLNTGISTLHLALGMVFFCLMVAISVQLSPGKKRPSSRDNFAKYLVVLSIFLVFLQILLGGFVRHVGAGLACGNDIVGCGPEFWPEWTLGKVHMIHRFFGYGVTLVVLMVSHVAFRSRVLLAHRLALIPTLLVVLQVALGLITVWTVRSVHWVILHTGVAGLLLASLVLLYFSFTALPKEVQVRA